MLDHRPKAVHHAHDTYHSRRDHPYCRRADAGDNVDGIVPFLGEEVAPRDDMFDLAGPDSAGE